MTFVLTPIVTLYTATDVLPIVSPSAPISYVTPDLLVSTALSTGNFKVIIGSSLGRGAPITKTADFTVGSSENWLINNKTGSICTVTLPTASLFVGREIMIQNWKTYTVVSASANVIPLAGGSALTAILAATAGKRATLVSNGSTWQIVDSN